VLLILAPAAGVLAVGVLLLGVAATGAGSLGRVPLAVITLTALAAAGAAGDDLDLRRQCRVPGAGHPGRSGY